MKRRRRLHRSSNAPRWMVVEVGLRCCGGPFVRHPDEPMPLKPNAHEPHTIARREWALVWPWRPLAPRRVWCEAYARLNRYERRERPFTMTADHGEDVKDRQVGD